jgi:ATP-dependent exoDNAse (exonuclease V) beta subunit
LVYAALRGPVFAFSDASLLELRQRFGPIHPFRKLPPDIPQHIAEIARALNMLKELHRRRNRRPIADTIADLMQRTRAHAGFAIWPTGEQALANVMRLGDMARRYEARGGAVSFRGFVDELEARAERDEASEVPVVEDGTEGVRIMTVHRAKGLEFPVVIFADLTCNETRRQASRFVDPARHLCAQELAQCAPRELRDNAEQEKEREREEAVRLLYVAATRARDLLVVPAVGDGEHEGWLHGLNDAIFPLPDKRRAPLDRKAPGCPEFGEDSVRERPKADSKKGTKAAPLKVRSVMPGVHRALAGEHRVVWWDPSTLELDVRETMGLRQSRLLEADDGKVASTAGIENWSRWNDARDRVIAAGKIPAMTVRTATELAAARERAAEGEPIEIFETAREPGRPHGPRFGTLVHMTMLRIALDAGADQIRAAAAGEGRILGAVPTEIDAATRAVSEALNSPLLARVRRSADVRRECPLLVVIENGTVVEGIADLVFVEQDGPAPVWNVIDFKTDLDLAPRIAEYRAQTALYLRAVRTGAGTQARGTIFWI